MNSYWVKFKIKDETKFLRCLAKSVESVFYFLNLKYPCFDLVEISKDSVEVIGVDCTIEPLGCNDEKEK